MTLESFRTHCLSKKGVTEEFPFGEETVVFKVMGKMFALADVETFESINLKCDPEQAVERREKYPSVTPGYHMNKKHWITVAMEGTIPDRLVSTWIDGSYALVVASLPKKTREKLA